MAFSFNPFTGKLDFYEKNHSKLINLLVDTHTQYALLAGRSGGQTLIGGTASGNNLTLQSTSHATKGKILFGTSAYDEVNNRLGIGTNASTEKVQIHSATGQNERLVFSGFDISTPFTGLLAGNISGRVTMTYALNGGMTFQAFTDADKESLWFQGHVGASSITIAPIVFDAYKQSGTGRTGVTGTERICDFRTGNAIKATLDATGRLFLGGTSLPTSILHLTAGTATANTAPLKFNSGTLLTTAEAGAVEFLTDKFYGTITTGAARKELTLNDSALTSGKIPIATTNGRLTDGQTPLTGTKVYYVADTSGGAVTRKLTFIDGILTAEV